MLGRTGSPFLWGGLLLAAIFQLLPGPSQTQEHPGESASNGSFSTSALNSVNVTATTTDANTYQTPPGMTGHGPSTGATSSQGGTLGSSKAALTVDPDGECWDGGPCPPLSSCVARRGRLACRCDVGYYFCQSVGCVPARSFPGRLTLQHKREEDRRSFSHSSLQRRVEVKLQPSEEHAESPEVEEQLEALLRRILNSTDGYLSSSIMDPRPSNDTMTVVHYFSTLSKVRTEDVSGTIDRHLKACGESYPGCVSLPYRVLYQAVSLCEFEFCDPLSTTCSSQDGILECQCLPGYSKLYPADHACTACRSGFRYNESGCERCPFGFGGFNCNEPFLLALLLVSIAAGGLLLLTLTFGVLLCPRKPKPKEPPHLFENAVRGMHHHSEALRLPRVRSIWNREVGGTGENSEFSRYVAHLGSPSSGSNEILSPSEVWMRTMMESQKSQVFDPRHGQQNLGFDNEELGWRDSSCPQESRASS